MDRKALNLPILISLVVGNMIGTGIYLLPASLASYGPISLISWGYTSIGAIFLALVLASLNRRFPKTGGPYVYCKEAYGRFVGFTIATLYWIGNMVSIAGIAVSAIGYLGFLFPMLDANTSSYNPMAVLIVELSTVWLFTLVNIIGVHAAGVVQLALTIIKVIPLLIITLVGLGSIHVANLTHLDLAGQPPLAAIGGAAALTFWAFIGLESATVPAENTAGSKDISKATVFGTLTTAVIYIASTIVLMGMIPSHELASSQFPFAAAGTMLFGPHSALIIVICAVISGLGAINVCVLVQGQIIFAAARDGFFPKVFSKLSKKDVPIAGHLLSTSLITIFLIATIAPTLLKQFNDIALFAALLTLTTYLVTTLSEIKFVIKEQGSIKQLMRSKAFYIALLAAAYAAWMIGNIGASVMLHGVIILLVAVPLYFLMSRFQKQVRPN